MPPITRWFIKTALLYFILALLAGLLLAVQKALPVALPPLFPVYIHLLVQGWITFLIIGVIIWMFPKYSREKPRGSQGLGWASYVLLNLGLVLRILIEPLHSATPNVMLGWGLVVSAILQWLGGMAFVANTWARVKEK